MSARIKVLSRHQAKTLIKGVRKRKMRTNECTGECCSGFTFKYGWKKKYRELSKVDVGQTIGNENDIMTTELLELVKFYSEMAILKRRNSTEVDFSWVDEEHRQAYKGQAEWTCKFWDKETTLCTVYDKRPEMCSKFPYKGICGVCGMVGPDAKEDARKVWCCWTHEAQYENYYSSLEDRKVYKGGSAW